MLHTITILAAMSATSGLMGHGKHCGGGGRMHHARGAMVAQQSAPMMSCGGSTAGYAMPTSSPMMSPQAPMMSPQGSMMGNTMARPTSPVYASPSEIVPPAPSVPPSPSAPSAPAPPAPSGL